MDQCHGHLISVQAVDNSGHVQTEFMLRL